MTRMLSHFTDPWSILLYLAVISYGIFLLYLTKIGLDSLQAKSENRPAPQSFPPGYFFWLAMSLISIAVIGIAREDSFLVGTRLFTLFVVILVAAAVKNPWSIFTWAQYKYSIGALIVIVLTAVTMWPQLEPVRSALSHNTYYSQTLAGWITIIIAAFFFWRGQGATAKGVWRDFRESQQNRFGMIGQLARLTTFVTQAVYFGVKGGIYDPICVACIITTVGSVWIILGQFRNLLFGQKVMAVTQPA